MPTTFTHESKPTTSYSHESVPVTSMSHEAKPTTSFSGESIPVTTFTKERRPGQSIFGVTWDEMNISWDDTYPETWDGPNVITQATQYTKETKP